MCGIGGIIGELPVTANKLALANKMAAQLQHRGPDGAGCYHDQAALLVHTRLSIIDLNTGQQPIHNEDKSVWVVFNGEIFNYLELRRDLERQGHLFYTQTDTEVIVHLYEQYGKDFVRHLNGQFAIALWDNKQKLAMLVRDRAGIAPLYYCRDGDCLVFASEIKAILSASDQAIRCNYQSLLQLATFWAPVSPDTVFANIYEVCPGQQLVFADGKITKETYWDLSFPLRQDFEPINSSEAAEQLREELIKATQLRLRADVPVAAYLSGGLDSSVITALIQQHSQSPLQTFSLTFAQTGLNEHTFQQQMAAYLGTQHSSVCFQDDDIADRFLTTIRHTETPIIRTAPIPMGKLSAHVHANNIKVVLTGEGADEVLGGYDIFKETKIRQFWARQTSSNRRALLLKKLYPYLNIPAGKDSVYLRNAFGQGLDNPAYPLFSQLTRISNTAKVRQFIHPQHLHRPEHAIEQDWVSRLPREFSHWHYFNQAQYLEFKGLMNGYLLSSQGDRMLMMNSLEGRFPYLDHHVIEFCSRLHPNLKMRVLNEKYVLKQAMRQYLPKEILNRFKQPYRAPMQEAFKSERGKQLVSEYLSENKIKAGGYFEAAKVNLLLRKILAGRLTSYGESMALVTVLSTQIWHDSFINYAANTKQHDDSVVFNCVFSS